MKIEKQSLNNMLKGLDDKKLMSFCKKIGNIYRKFPEYAYWSEKCKEGKEKCDYCEKYFEEGIVEPEIHHSPDTLTDIFYDVVLDLLEKGEEFDTLKLISIVNDLHYSGYVSYDCICSCCHKIEHLKRKAK